MLAFNCFCAAFNLFLLNPGLVTFMVPGLGELLFELDRGVLRLGLLRLGVLRLRLLRLGLLRLGVLSLGRFRLGLGLVIYITQ